MKKTELVKGILKSLRRAEYGEKDAVLPYMFGWFLLAAKDGDKDALGLCEEIARILQRPDWLEEIGLK